MQRSPCTDPRSQAAAPIHRTQASFDFHNDEAKMKVGDFLIPYDAQCPHGNYYDYCQVCSGAKADFERWCYEIAEEWEASPHDISKAE